MVRDIFLLVTRSSKYPEKGRMIMVATTEKKRGSERESVDFIFSAYLLYIYIYSKNWTKI